MSQNTFFDNSNDSSNGIDYIETGVKLLGTKKACATTHVVTHIHTNEAENEYLKKKLLDLKLWTKRNHDIEGSAIHNRFDEQNTITLCALHSHFIFVKGANFRDA